MAFVAERVGRTIRGKWHLDALIGVGGMAAVYAATHRNGGRAAIKVLHAELAAMREIRGRFVREGYLANRVGHPAVVRAIDDDTDEDGLPYLVMELVDGETLAQRAETEVFSAEELLAVAEQVLPALASGHARGVVHQDLKPENLLVDGDGRVRLLDYGIARTLDDSETLKIHTTGTPSFMSPEQVQGIEPIGPPTDIYSFGATLFALATGRPPHVAKTAMHLLVKISTERAPRVASLAPELPELVAALIDRALARDLTQRWRSADAMLAEVERIREVLEIPSSPLALACRHGATLPDGPFTESTGSVRAMVVSSTPRRQDRATAHAAPVRTPRTRAPVIAAALIVAAAAGLVLGRSRPAAPPIAPAVRTVDPPREIEAPKPIPVVETAPVAASASSAPLARPKKKLSKPAETPRAPAGFPGGYKDSPY